MSVYCDIRKTRMSTFLLPQDLTFFSSSMKQNGSSLEAGLGSSIKILVSAAEEVLSCTACSFLPQSMLSYFSNNTKTGWYRLCDRPVLEFHWFGKAAELKF